MKSSDYYKWTCQPWWFIGSQNPEHSPQFSSSELSPQSSWASHFQRRGMQWWFLHRKSPGLHGTASVKHHHFQDVIRQGHGFLMIQSVSIFLKLPDIGGWPLGANPNLFPIWTINSLPLMGSRGGWARVSLCRRETWGTVTGPYGIKFIIGNEKLKHCQGLKWSQWNTLLHCLQWV